ncbi:hypothetical protein AVEN_125541-1 [Araneus ventricosus]|uniref:Secreted protein n=1 Tax=Araneus ventricosus TaxID=182803 RepID=A0A4Y2X6P9_ARAVE|nr:hypothetical protein AVEN_125541-1 [Araneus ventricosus]
MEGCCVPSLAVTSVCLMSSSILVCSLPGEPINVELITTYWLPLDEASSPFSVSPESAGTDGSFWKQDRDCRRDGRTPPSIAPAAIVVCAVPLEGECGCGAVSFRCTEIGLTV